MPNLIISVNAIYRRCECRPTGYPPETWYLFRKYISPPKATIPKMM